MSSNITIGQAILNLRKAKGSTQEDLAIAVNVSAQAVSKWENGGMPDVELFPQIAKYFNVTTDFLFGLEDNNFENFEKKLSSYIGTFKTSDKFFKMFELGYIMMVSNGGKTDLSTYDYKKIMKGKGANSLDLKESGIALASIKESKPFYAVFPTPVDGSFNGVLETKDMQLDFFKELSSKDFYDALVLLNTRDNTSFTSSLLENKLGITNTRAEEIISKLCEYSLLFTDSLVVDDKIISIYKLYNNPAIIGLFAFCDMIVNRPQSFYYHNYTDHVKYFK